MVNFFKKSLIYLALMLLVLVSFNVESASAAEVIDYEEGVTNLNNTPENSAVVGDRLLKPEIGWKRYDDSNLKIEYLGNVERNQNSLFYNSGYSSYKLKYPYDNELNGVKFNFTGTKIRLISLKDSVYRSSNIVIEIDGVTERFNQTGAATKQTLVYEKTGLNDKQHSVFIYADDKTSKVGFDKTVRFEIDAIDIDGDLTNIDSSESISLDRNSLELLEGSQDKLTASVTPDTAKVIWTSSDESIATVDQDGNVTALHEGEVIITAKIEGTDITATSTVIVKKPSNESSNAILSITMVNGITKEYDVTNTVLNNYLNWFESAQGTSTFKFSKTISPYKKVTEYIVHDKIASFEVREY
ncbi:Ig-like domain-containing protein [Lysinibacillus sp. FSL M8-0216]|uniref:Ig-like domain-containing protein n=1 Tax=Lysinibacillus sp. FSL M8-0216 TaxID=2921619 RepID=UPI003159E5F3